MQKWHKIRHFGQKIKLYMQNFSVGEVEITFSVLFFCQNIGVLFIFLCSSKGLTEGLIVRDLNYSEFPNS